MRKPIFTFLCISSIFSAAYFSFIVETPNYAMTGIYLAFSLFMLAFGWPEIAKSISFLGNNIELREVRKAIDELKPLAEVFSKSVLELMQGGSRWGGIPEVEREKTYISIEHMLKGLAFSQKEIEIIQKRWHDWIEIDYVHAIILPHSSIDHPEVPKEKKKEWSSMYHELKQKRLNLLPEDIRASFKKIGCYTPKIEKAINDYEFYKKNKTHRSIERWHHRENWFKE